MCTNSFKPYEKPFELILPCKNSLYGVKSLFENRKIEQGFTATLGLLPISLVGLDVGFHARIEDLLAVFTTIIDSVETHGRSLKIETYSFCNTLQWAHCFTYEGGLILVARGKDHGSNDVAVAITYGDDLITLHVFMAVVA